MEDAHMHNSAGRCLYSLNLRMQYPILRLFPIFYRSPFEDEASVSFWNEHGNQQTRCSAYDKCYSVNISSVACHKTRTLEVLVLSNGQFVNAFKALFKS
jgi:hypothetical protein